MSKRLDNMLRQALDNGCYRKVLLTGDKTQIVVMSIGVGDEIGSEVHQDNEQILINVSGKGKAIVEGEENSFDEGDVVVVRPGIRHNFINVGGTPLKIITLYAPPHHPDGTIHKTKQEALAAEKR